MNTGVKAILYLILVIAAAVTGYHFFQNFGKLFEEEKAKAPAVAAPAVETNAAVSAVTETNLVVEGAETNAAPATLENVAETNGIGAVAPPAAPAPGRPPSRIGFWTGAFILTIIALGGLIAWDVSNFMGSRTLKVIYNDDGAGMKDKEYEEAEKVWANGQPLEAIRMLRDYLNKNPREIHVALRIAEIYEKDLSNFLAAALEYEEVLKCKLEDERWGWAAIHLCNLYFKLGQEVKGFALLQRIVKDYGETQAAEKARKRLSEVDPGLLTQAETEGSKAAPEPGPSEPKSSLPPGFRPKK